MPNTNHPIECDGCGTELGYSAKPMETEIFWCDTCVEEETAEDEDK